MKAEEADKRKNDPGLNERSVESTIVAIIGQYNLPSDWHVIQGPSGMNNTTRLIACADGRYALRVYNNHQNADIVKLEHFVLQFLLRTGFPLMVPEPVKNRRGDSITSSANGKLASLFRYIEGERPSAADLDQVESLGQAAGLLSEALARLPKTGHTLEYLPYYELEQSYEGWFLAAS